MAKTVHFVVKFELPDGATKQAAANYVREAVQVHRGSLWNGDDSFWDDNDPDPDPMFMLDSKTVTVRPYFQVRVRRPIGPAGQILSGAQE